MKKIFYILCFTALLFTCDDIFELVDISDDTVSILAPTDEAVLNATSLTFSWNAVEDAETYHLQIARPTFDAALQIVKDTIVSTTNYATILEFDTYEWRIRAENSGYHTNYTTQGFTIEE